jgi:hypothetical protein
MHRQTLFSLLITLLLLAGSSVAQEPPKREKNRTVAPAAAGPVSGSGTSGRISKWAGIEGTNTYVLGDSNIFEDKFGKLGIGTTAPTSLLTIRGMVETTLGGYKFPDGTVQTTSAAGALFTVAHDATLKGSGTAASPLGVNVPLQLTGTAIFGIIQLTNTGASPALVARSLGTFGDAAIEAYAEDAEAILAESLMRPGVLGRSIGDSNGYSSFAYVGVEGVGADRNAASGGAGMMALGGQGGGAGNTGGIGLHAKAGEGSNGATKGRAGLFEGDVEITGKLMVTSGIKMFHIDHPLDPENKYLNHAAIESSEVLNIYSGNIITDNNGDAVVTLPAWFEALNKDFRYQLTVFGTFAQAIVAEKIKGNRFAIKTNASQVEVSWQVTGVRSDPGTRKFNFDVEEEKPQRHRGYFLNPDAYNQPAEKSIQSARERESTPKLKQQRNDPEQRRKQQPDQR